MRRRSIIARMACGLIQRARVALGRGHRVMRGLGDLVLVNDPARAQATLVAPFELIVTF